MNEPSTVRSCWYSLFRDVLFLNTFFDRLIDCINRIIIKFENTSQEFCIYMEIFHTGTNFEKKLEQKPVGRIYLLGIKNETIM